tara:strand:+ start:2775 stop:3698 length:924 start_codon:yes stop_codon:yes gene_type:complete
MSKATQHLEQVQEAIEEQMRTVGMDWSKSWTSGGIPRNASTQKAYRGVNHFWLSMNCLANGYEHNEWMTFKQAEKMGCKIIPNKQMPDEKSTSQIIIFYKPMPKGKKYYTDADRAQVAKGNTPMIPMLKSYRVFHVSQVEGYEPVSSASNHVSEICAKDTKKIETYFSNIGSIVKSGEPCYIPSLDEIRMPSKDKFESDVAYYGTWGHEEIHKTGHKSRLNRLKKNASFGTESYAFEELVAELGSIFLCLNLGIESTPRDDHAKYLNGWLKVIKKDKKALYRAFSQAQKAVDFLDDLQVEKKQSKVA